MFLDFSSIYFTILITASSGVVPIPPCGRMLDLNPGPLHQRHCPPDALTTRLDFFQNIRLDLIARSHPQSRLDFIHLAHEIGTDIE